MYKLNSLAALAAVFLLAGCGALSGLVTSPVAVDPNSPKLNAAQAAVYQARAKYDGVFLSAAAGYSLLPTCGSPGASKLCSDPGIVTQLRKADASIGVAFDGAEKIAATNGATDTVSLLADANTAIDTVGTVITVYKLPAADALAQSAASDVGIVELLPTVITLSMDSQQFLNWADAAGPTQQDLDELHALEATVRTQLNQ
ncbi:MAG TPA: hypothetical protein VGG48_14150 [Rhizomicrobium sp.]|jgi:hypothetical protein